MSERRERDLLHPVALAALAVLIVNDRFLKAAWPSWWTGKLSDVAGMMFFPLLLAAVVGRRHRRACIVVTMIAFALVKLWPPATALCEHVLGLFNGGDVAIVRDPTDLVALPFALWCTGSVAVSTGHGHTQLDQR
ncbi:MAG: hypothetical protein ABI175_16345 [Polyangiales bacterium]